MAFPRAPDAPALTQAEALSYDWRPNDCPVSRTMEVIGGKWKPSILYLLCRGPARFNALQRALPGITQRMLTLQLREPLGVGGKTFPEGSLLVTRLDDFLAGKRENLLHPRGVRNVPDHLGLGTGTDLLLDFHAHRFEV